MTKYEKYRVEEVGVGDNSFGLDFDKNRMAGLEIKTDTELQQ
jgi:hypothetical protein